MSDYTRAQIIAAAEDEAEAVGSSRWSTTLKQQRLDWVFTQEWRKILAANPTYRWALRTATANAFAQVPYIGLDNGLGDTLERFSKVLALANGETMYSESRFTDHPLLVTSGGSAFTWWNEGDHIALPAADANAQQLKIWINHTPQKPSLLAGDSSIVVFPRDYSGVLVYELAAKLLAKGGTETDLALELKGIAEEIRREMLDEITRRSVKPLFVDPVDSPSEWGSR